MYTIRGRYNYSAAGNAMELIHQFGEMWARTPKNIKKIKAALKRPTQAGVYILYDGATPVYIGKGNIPYRLEKATRNKRKNFWDHFSWYVITDETLMHDVEVLLLRALPPFLHYHNGQSGNFTNEHLSTDQHPPNQAAEYITRRNIRRRSL